ncbi:casein kinase I-like [Panulirus ornatus]|uniref:casein kinase I-like n=1 Tax=Panulirus ornatus TaxID=150431 RepID=UPI003A86DE32
MFVLTSIIDRLYEVLALVQEGLGMVPHDVPLIRRVQKQMRLAPRCLQVEQADSDSFSSISFVEVDKKNKRVPVLSADERNLVIRPNIDVVRHIRTLGRGGNGSVDLVYFKGHTRVMKTLLRGVNIRGLLKEIRIQRDLAGAGGAPEIHGLSLVPAKVIMTYTGQTYDQYIKECTQQEAVRTLMLVAQKLDEIHEKGYAHNDLKVNNITVGVSKNVDIHIIDYGLSTRLGKVLWPSGKRRVRRCWYAPELYAGKPATRASDVYSFGDVIANVSKRVYNREISGALTVLQKFAMKERPADRPTLSALIKQLEVIVEAVDVM